ncbi:oncoprotein-induced transcript 3 protein-like [Saccostrea echinata]|uniref:oncoprotein-induced transcript 3 protein-like n=1 Tax=Saccostrea echinata TaxID=191078 RepID=UPI002A839336|nr:oncoprotein-induced transcript 3 protein-like [Saccostrea echinata]
MNRREIPWLQILCLVIATDAQYHCNVADPCTQANVSRFFEPHARYKNCQYDPKYGLCDRYITPQWYRVDDKMLTECPELLSCGALYPVWLRGSLPLISDGVVGRKACKVGFNDCCREEVDVKIKHCGLFYAYCLGAMSACSERYCFGENGSCDVPQSTTSTEITINPLTTIRRPFSSQIPPSEHPCSQDPCIVGHVHDLSDPKERSMNCEYNQNIALCDKFLTPGWGNQLKHCTNLSTQKTNIIQERTLIRRSTAPQESNSTHEDQHHPRDSDTRTLTPRFN